MSGDRALALAGGGAKGAFQAGALLYLAERGMTFDRVGGTSIGALNGAFYSQGDGSAGHMEDLCRRWRALPDAGLIQISGSFVQKAVGYIFAQQLPTFRAWLIKHLADDKKAILDPKPVERLLDKWIDFDAICSGPRELVITALREIDPAVDIITAPWRSASYFTARDLGPAELRNALLASAAIPMAFPSREVKGKRYNDAGLVDPLPGGELYRRGARRILSIFLDDDTVQNRADYPGATLLQIRPSEVIDHGLKATFDFSREAIERLIDQGYRDAEETIGEAQQLWEELMFLRKQGDANMALANALPDRSRRR